MHSPYAQITFVNTLLFPDVYFLYELDIVHEHSFSCHFGFFSCIIFHIYHVLVKIMIILFSLIIE